LSSDKTQIDRTTVFEDKCSDDPISTFKHKVIPAFRDRHENKRSAEIVAAATALLGKAGIDEGGHLEKPLPFGVMSNRSVSPTLCWLS
jgi:hypothetical protein